MTAKIPGAHAIVTPRARLVLMEAAFIETILGGRHGDAEVSLGATIPRGWPDAGDTWLLQIRLADMIARPSSRPWLLRAIVRSHDDVMIGHAGFHGPPGPDRVAELGYTVFPEARRQGFAEEAARALLQWASDEHGITRFRAAVGPRNEPSLALVRKIGFHKVGVQWDERDGEEIVFELRSG